MNLLTNLHTAEYCNIPVEIVKSWTPPGLSFEMVQIRALEGNPFMGDKRGRPLWTDTAFVASWSLKQHEPQWELDGNASGNAWYICTECGMIEPELGPAFAGEPIGEEIDIEKEE